MLSIRIQKKTLGQNSHSWPPVEGQKRSCSRERKAEKLRRSREQRRSWDGQERSGEAETVKREAEKLIRSREKRRSWDGQERSCRAKKRTLKIEKGGGGGVVFVGYVGLKIFFVGANKWTKYKEICVTKRQRRKCSVSRSAFSVIALWHRAYDMSAIN